MNNILFIYYREISSGVLCSHSIIIICCQYIYYESVGTVIGLKCFNSYTYNILSMRCTGTILSLISVYFNLINLINIEVPEFFTVWPHFENLKYLVTHHIYLYLWPGLRFHSVCIFFYKTSKEQRRKRKTCFTIDDIEQRFSTFLRPRPPIISSRFLTTPLL